MTLVSTKHDLNHKNNFAAKKMGVSKYYLSLIADQKAVAHIAQLSNCA